MATLLITFVILVFIVAGMAVGVLFGGKPIKGTCGGLNNAEGGSSCQLCGGDPVKCEETAEK